jgi:uncharacterized protein
LQQRQRGDAAHDRRGQANADERIEVKFHLQAPSANVVTGCGPDWVRVGTDEYRENLVLTPDQVTPGFAPAGFDALTSDDFAALLASAPEIVLLGTGATQRFLRPSITAPLHDANVGLEVMDTRAACRTYNILVAEGRAVTAALIVKDE